MSETPPAEGICIHCGTSRPVDEPLCPSCGKPWIDERVDTTAPPGAPTAAAAATAGAAVTEPDDAPPDAGVGAAAVGAATGAAAAASLDDTGEYDFADWTMPPEQPNRQRAVWLIPIILLIAAAAVWALVFLDDNSTTATTVAAPTTTVGVTTTEGGTTTVPEATTTTVAETTTTVIAYPPPDAWEPVGEPIDPADLTLKAAAIGPLDFGIATEEAAGRLTASLGEAESSGIDGLCPPDESYYLQWGELKAIFDGAEPDATFVSYRYEDVGSDTELGLATLSGLELGDTVADLKRIYSSFTITFEVIDGQDHFRLLDGGELLLWGPVTSSDDAGIVVGIYSPTRCDDDT